MMSTYFKKQLAELEEYIADNLEPREESLEDLLEGIHEDTNEALAFALETVYNNYY